METYQESVSRPSIHQSKGDQNKLHNQVAEIEVLDKVTSMLAPTFSDFFEAVNQRFFGLAEQSKYPQQQGQYLSIIETLSPQNSLFLDAFRQSICSRFAGEAAQPEFDRTLTLDAKDFALTETDALDHELAVAKLCRDLSGSGKAYLQSATEVYGRQIAKTVLTEENFPYSPANLTKAVRTSCDRLLKFVEENATISRLFEAAFAARADRFYQELYQFLEPRMSLEVDGHGGDPTALDALDSMSMGSKQNEFELLPLAGENTADGESTKATAADALQFSDAKTDAATKPNWQAIAAYTSDIDWELVNLAYDEPKQVDDSKQPRVEPLDVVIAALYQLQRKVLVFKQDQPLDLAAALDRLTASSDFDWRYLSNLLLTVQNVNAVFEALLTLEDFHPQVRLQLARLQIPCVIYALQERRGLPELSHFGQLIDTIADIAIGWPDLDANQLARQDGASDSRIGVAAPLPMIKAGLDNLLHSSMPMAEACAAAVDQLDSVWLPNKRRQMLMRQRLMAMEEGKAKLEKAKEKAKLVYSDIRAGTLCVAEADEIFDRYLQRALVLCLLKHTFHHESWDQLVSLLRLLVSASSYSKNNEERREKRALANSLAVRLRQVANEYRVSDQSFSPALKALLVAIIKPRVAAEYCALNQDKQADPHRLSNLGSSPAHSGKNSAKASFSLGRTPPWPVGSWLKVIEDTGETQLRIASINKSLNQMTLVNRSSTSIRALSFEEIEDRTADKKLSVIFVTDLLVRIWDNLQSVTLVSNSLQQPDKVI